MKEELRGEGGSDVFSSTRHVNPNAVRARFHVQTFVVHKYIWENFQPLGLRSNLTAQKCKLVVRTYLLK